MRCTANYRPFKAVGGSVRCEREIGHAGLHRHTVELAGPTSVAVQEFPDSRCWFPQYDIPSEETV